MDNTTSDQEPPKSDKDVPVLSKTNDEIRITDAEFSTLTYRQKFVLTEYKYLLTPEDAEQVGKMLGSLAQEKDVIAFCQAHGSKVYAHDKLEQISSAGEMSRSRIMFGVVAGAIGGILVQLAIMAILAGQRMDGVQGIIDGILFTPVYVIDPIPCVMIRALLGGFTGYVILLNRKLRHTKAIYAILIAFIAGFLITGIVTFCAAGALVQ